MSTSTTFRVSEKEPAVYGDGEIFDFKISLPNLKHYKENHCTEVLQGTEFPKNSRLCGIENGFIDTVITCYNRHHNIVLRPDDIWTAIMTQFSFYVNKHAEKFRNKFVNFEGKRELVVSTWGNLRSVSYALLAKEMSKKIDENLVDPNFKSWILPSFSTSTDNDLVTCGVVFMATMKKYFDYTFSLMCGIPYVTLEGTVGDWANLSQRLEKLKEYELEEWYSLLKPILEEFINAKKGSPDVSFWNRICSHHGGGSGPSYISGWIVAFCVFDKYGNWQGQTKAPGQTRYKVRTMMGSVESDWPIIDTNNIPPGIIEVDVKIDDNGVPYYSSMFAGHLAINLSDDGKTLLPMSGWVICLKPSPEEIKKIEADLLEKEPWRKEYVEM